LARACRAGTLITLLISDVLGDPLDVIASGPTVPDTKSPADALEVLRRFDARAAGISPAVFQYLEQAVAVTRREGAAGSSVINLVIGNNAVAVDAAGIEAERRGYAHAMLAANALEGPAEDVGRHLAEMAIRMRDEPGPDCLITGGEPTVRLVPAEQRGLGGRNQQLVLGALLRLLETQDAGRDPLRDLALLSGGTDGEDGPTDAAGAFVDAAVGATLRHSRLDPADSLRRNDAYRFFEPLHALLKTGPTHTNVCDVRVVTVSRPQVNQ
jgi:glycerate-2-kinase